MFSVEQHEWPIEPFMAGADLLSVVEFGGSEVMDVFIPLAGGRFSLPGEYVWNNQRLPYSQSGQWGYFRVHASGDQRILPLNGGNSSITEAALPQTEKPQIQPVRMK